MAMAIHLRRRFSPLLNPNITINLFSSSSNTNPNEENPNPQSQSQSQSQPSPQSSMSNYFSQVKASLKSTSPSRKPHLSSSNPSQFASLQEIRKNLSEYRDLTALSPPDSKRLTSLRSNNSPISFRELYEKHNVGGDNSSGSGIARYSFDGIRESLKKFRPNHGGVGIDRNAVNKDNKDRFSLNGLKGDFRLKPDFSTKSTIVAGGRVALPRQDNFDTSSSEASLLMKNELIRTYRYEELGEKLRRLRPGNAKPGQNWFSLAELNERLIKLREIEERESNKNIRGVQFGDIRESIQKLKLSAEEAEEKKKKSTLQLQNLNLLASLRGNQSYMLSPPKDDLVEKYFHPDNMSSADKLKLELKKSRDEFKMSESDCGSSRVQVAQLTVKIKHLSSALHKKDKHSRKGLQEMVVRRKKLLKYLRRTDWDSYCFCLSKLGLRDNPDYKN